MARTDLLANQIALVLSDTLGIFNSRVLQPPVELPEIGFRIFWSSRVAKDPGIVWLRRLVIESTEDVQRRSEARIEEAGVLPVRD